MGDGTAMKLDKNNLFTRNKQNCRILYNEYKIWCRVMRKENMGKNFYEYKTQYTFVRGLSLIGAILFILNIFLKYYHLFGTAVMLLAILLTLYFSKIFKRTEGGNEQYQEWLAFKRYLEEIENFDIKVEDPNEYVMYGVILNVPYVEEKLTNNNFFGGIIDIIDANIVNAIIKGKR